MRSSAAAPPMTRTETPSSRTMGPFRSRGLADELHRPIPLDVPGPDNAYFFFFAAFFFVPFFFAAFFLAATRESPPPDTRSVWLECSVLEPAHSWRPPDAVWAAIRPSSRVLGAGLAEISKQHPCHSRHLERADPRKPLRRRCLTHAERRTRAMSKAWISRWISP